MALPTRVTLFQRPDQPLDIVSARLKQWDCQIHDCVSWDQIEAHLGRGATDLILIDVATDDGMELLTALKSASATRHLPVVLVTSEDAPSMAARALALGADDLFVLPIEDAELTARVRALARLANMEVERARRQAVLAEFGVGTTPETPAVPALDRIGILLIGPAGGEQVEVMTALSGAATVTYAESSDSALERLRRDDLDVALITAGEDHAELEQLCAEIRGDAELFDLPVLLVGRPEWFPEHDRPFTWGVSDLLFRPFLPEVLRLRVQAWVRQQRLRRRLRGTIDDHHLPTTVDRLTRLYGHGFLHSYLDTLIRQAQANDVPVSIAVFGIANLGQINRTQGYGAGDRALELFGHRLARTTRAEDCPARIGADRFCLVMNGASAEEAHRASERVAAIATRTAMPLADGGQLQLTLETGAAELAAGDDAATLIKRALEQRQPYGIRRAS